MLRRIARVSGRRLVLLWLALVIVEGGLLVAGAVAERHRHSAGILGAAFDTLPARPLTAAGRDSLAAFVLAATRPLEPAAAARRDTALAALGRERALSARARDSLLQVAGVPAHLSTAQRDSAKASLSELLTPLFTGVGQMLSSPGFLFAIVAAVLVVYGPPLLLLVFTGLWIVARRRYPREHRVPGVA